MGDLKLGEQHETLEAMEHIKFSKLSIRPLRVLRLVAFPLLVVVESTMYLSATLDTPSNLWIKTTFILV